MQNHLSQAIGLTLCPSHETLFITEMWQACYTSANLDIIQPDLHPS